MRVTRCCGIDLVGGRRCTLPAQIASSTPPLPPPSPWARSRQASLQPGLGTLTGWGWRGIGFGGTQCHTAVAAALSCGPIVATRAAPHVHAARQVSVISLLPFFLTGRLWFDMCIVPHFARGFYNYIIFAGFEPLTQPTLRLHQQAGRPTSGTRTLCHTNNQPCALLAALTPTTKYKR